MVTIFHCLLEAKDQARELSDVREAPRGTTNGGRGGIG